MKTDDISEILPPFFKAFSSNGDVESQSCASFRGSVAFDESLLFFSAVVGSMYPVAN